MALALTSVIEASLATGRIATVECVKIDFGHGDVRFLSTAEIGPTLSGDGRTYEPRLLSVSSLPFVASGKERGTASLTIDNSGNPGYFLELINRGFRVNGARVSIIRIFPGLDPQANKIGTWENPYWAGYVSSYQLNASKADLTMATGFQELNRRSLRRYSSSCNNEFSDGLHCGYQPLAGHGLPDALLSGSATGGSSTTLVDSSADFAVVSEGDFVLNLTDDSVARVASVATSTLTLDGLINGSANTFSSSDRYVVGPVFTDCPLSKQGCQERGMFSTSDGQSAADLPKYRRRWFEGLLSPSSVPFLTRATDSQGREGLFSHTANSNDGIDGTPVVAIHGSYRRRECDLIGLAVGDSNQEHPFSETLWGVSAGRVDSMSSPRVDDYPPDDVSPEGTSLTQDSFIVYNVMHEDAQDQGPVSSGELSEEQRQLGVAPLDSYAKASRLEAASTLVSNPYLFNNAQGDGVSWAGLAMVRIRTQPDGLSDAPKLSIDVVGRTRVIPGQDLGTNEFTITPDPIQVLYHYLRDRNGGAGLADSQLHLESFRSASDICRETVMGQTAHARISSTVAAGPDSTGVTSSGSKNWLVTTAELPKGLQGQTINVSTSGGTASMVIESAIRVPVNRVSSISDDVMLLSPDIETGSRTIHLPIIVADYVFVVRTTAAFPSGKVPGAGNSFVISLEGHASLLSPRYKFNGCLSEDNSVGETIDSILQNCGGHLVSKGGRLCPVIPRPVDLATVLATTVFRDSGPNRNIIQGSLAWGPRAGDTTANEIEVSFADREQDFTNVRRKVVDLQAQRFSGQAFSENSRSKAAATLSLNGTSSLDQALRLAATKLREIGSLPGNRDNGSLSFDLPLPDAIGLVPWEDVHAIESEVLPAYLPGTFRLVMMEENPNRATVKTTWAPEYAELYGDQTTDIGMEDPPFEQEDAGTVKAPRPVPIESLTDEGFVDPEGNFKERLIVSVTLQG